MAGSGFSQVEFCFGISQVHIRRCRISQQFRGLHLLVVVCYTYIFSIDIDGKSRCPGIVDEILCRYSLIRTGFFVNNGRDIRAFAVGIVGASDVESARVVGGSQRFQQFVGHAVVYCK